MGSVPLPTAPAFQQRLLGLQAQLYHFARKLTRDHVWAQDLTQESMLRALQYQDTFREHTNFKAWLLTIMRNTFINEHRRNKRKHALLESLGTEALRAAHEGAASGTESLVKQGELDHGLALLDGAFREPFRLYHDGYKYHEIAERLGLPIGTVKSRIHKARQRLIHMLDDAR